MNNKKDISDTSILIMLTVLALACLSIIFFCTPSSINQPVLKGTYMGDSSLITPEFRGSYVTLFKPKAVKGSDKEKYGMLVALKPGKETTKFIAKLTAVINQKMIDKFGKVLKAPKFWPIIDGDTWDENGMDDDETNGVAKVNPFAGMTLIRANSNFKPEVVNMQGIPIVKEADLYSGAWYRALLTPWCWSGEFGRGVSISLDSVLKIKDDDRIGRGSAPANKVFSAYMEDGEEADETADSEDEEPVIKKKTTATKAVVEEDEDEEPVIKKKTTATKAVVEEDEDEEPVIKKKKKTATKAVVEEDEDE